MSIHFNLNHILWLFTAGILIGVNLQFLFKSMEIRTCAVQLELEDPSVADLYDKVKILCLVLTTESHHETKAIHVKNTWGSRCSKLIFVSNVTDTELGSVKFTENDHYDLIWGKTKRALAYAYENFYDDYDWFFKADDDTYAVLDNMRLMLSAYSPDDPIYFGKKLKTINPLGFFHGGSGYVMSKEALKKFVNQALPGDYCRPDDEGQEDNELANCMYHIGVYPGDARDRFLRERFHPFTPEKHLFSFPNGWYWYYLYYVNDEGLDGSSNSTISYHYIKPDMMYLLEYLIFNLQAYGVRHGYDSLPEKKNFTVVVQTLLAEICETNIIGFY